MVGDAAYDAAAAGESTSEQAGGVERRQAWPARYTLAAVAILAVLIGLPRLVALDRFITVDEPRWATRSANFYYALAHGDLAHTYQTEHPGVTTMWAGAAGIFWRFAAYRDVGQGEVGAGKYERVLLQYGHDLPELLAAGRTFVVVIHILVLVLVFLLGRRLIGPWPALAAVVLIALDPLHAAHSRVLHLDGLLSSLMLLAVVAFLCFVHERRLWALIVSGAAAGLSWLTKTPGFFLIPAVGLIAGIDLVRQVRSRNGAPWGRVVWAWVWPLLVWAAVAGGVFVVLWPAMWVDPVGTLSDMLTTSLFYAEEGHSGPVYFAGVIYADGQVPASVWYFYPVTFLWRTTPVVLAGLVAAAVAWPLQRGPFARPAVRRAAAGLLLFVGLFVVVMTLGTKKFDRYLLPVHLALDVVAALGWVAVADWLAKRAGAGVRRYAVVAVLGAVLVVHAVGVVGTYPYYFSYYNPLLGGSARAPEVMMIGWGEGLDEAARLLDAKPEAGELAVASWYGDSFSPYFSGATRDIPFFSELSEAGLAKVLSSDYVVLYANQWQRQMPGNLLERLQPLEPESRIWIDGLEYARLYRLGDTAAGTTP